MLLDAANSVEVSLALYLSLDPLESSIKGLAEKRLHRSVKLFRGTALVS